MLEEFYSEQEQSLMVEQQASHQEVCTGDSAGVAAKC
jgi:hypothetical protein